MGTSGFPACGFLLEGGRCRGTILDLLWKFCARSRMLARMTATPVQPRATPRRSGHAKKRSRFCVLDPSMPDNISTSEGRYAGFAKLEKAIALRKGHHASPMMTEEMFACSSDDIFAISLEARPPVEPEQSRPEQQGTKQGARAVQSSNVAIRHARPEANASYKQERFDPFAASIQLSVEHAVPMVQRTDFMGGMLGSSRW
jgi:hypothetical protein